MQFSLIPKNNLFFSWFEELSRNASQAAVHFRELIDNWHTEHTALEQLQKIEHASDKIVHQIMVKLNQTFITPIDREDIQTLTKKMDDIIDILQALGSRLVLFKIKTITPEFRELAEVFQKTIIVLEHAVAQIKDLKDTQSLLDRCIHIHSLENQGDRLFEKAIGSLFADNAHPIEVIKWKEMYEFIESGIDACEDVADILWGLAIKYG